jgi:hypothetical protein
MPVAFSTEPIACPGCHRAFERGVPDTDDVYGYELAEGDDGPAAVFGHAADLDALGDLLSAVKPCHTVRGITVGKSSAADGSFLVGVNGFRWTFRGDE